MNPKSNQDQDLSGSPSDKVTEPQESYNYTELGGPFAAGFDKTNTAQNNRLQAMYRAGQRSMRAKIEPIEPSAWMSTLKGR